MVRRSRTTFLLMVVATALTLAGPAGCASAKPRDHWWQFWRPKRVDTASIFHPDKVILPPPPDAIGHPGIGDESVALGRTPADIPPPPTTLTAADMVEPDPVRRAALGAVSSLQTVHFAYDSAELDDEARAVLDQNARWLLANPQVEIQIEGHCDERGTVEYNLMLGERRARSVKAYLVSRGVPASMLHTISYGEERPVDPRRTEAAFSLNRRAQFLVY